MDHDVPVAASRFDKDWASYGCHAASVRKLFVHGLVTVALALVMALMLATTLCRVGSLETSGTSMCVHHKAKEAQTKVGVYRGSGQGVEGDYQRV
jgi:hypothetical protein